MGKVNLYGYGWKYAMKMPVRRVIPFNNMLPGDAYLWSRYRDDDILMESLKIYAKTNWS